MFNILGVYQQQGGLDIEAARKLAAEMNCSVERLLGPQDNALPFGDIAPTFVRGAPLVSKERLDEMPTHMRNLHKCYLDLCTRKPDERWIRASIHEEYYFRREDLHIEICELWQLFNLDALDKSLMSCYCV